MRISAGETGFGVHLAKEVRYQRRQVLAAFGKRWKPQRKDVEAVEQVFAEPAVYDRLFQILVRGGNDPDVDGLRLVAADALDLAFLQHTKQFYLHVGRHIADFVEDDRSERHTSALQTLMRILYAV